MCPVECRFTEEESTDFSFFVVFQIKYFKPSCFRSADTEHDNTKMCSEIKKSFMGRKKKSILHLVFFHPVNVSSTLEQSEIKLILINQNQFLIYLHISLLNILNKCIGN